jgi:hypothetical protein
LYANLCQEIPPPNPPNGLLHDTEFFSPWSKIACLSFVFAFTYCSLATGFLSPRRPSHL